MPDYDYELAICAIFKNEAPYLREWIQYHKMLGVQHFYLYNNDSEDNYLNEIQTYIDDDLVTLFDIPGRPVQIEAYNHFLENYREKVKWAAIIDLDEFIVPTEGPFLPDAMADILKRAEQKINTIGNGFTMDMIAGIQLSWLYYGTSFHVEPPSGLVLENYLNRIAIEDNNTWNKCIYYLNNIATIPDPHYAIPKEGKIFIDENGDFVPVCARSFSTKVKYLRINHYTTRSLLEHVYKLTERGWADGLEITEEHKNHLLIQGQTQFNKVYDPITLRYVPALKNRLK